MDNLKQKTINGMIWTISERLGLQLLQLVVSIILARLLQPAEFGLISMLMLFTAIAQSLLDSGFGSALIQKKDATQTDASSIFFFNIFIGIILATILSLGAPLIANFYQQPILIPLTRVLSLNLIINAFSVVQTSLLTKNMDFKAQLKVSIASVLISGTAGIIMAFQGLGVWSLVVQMVLNQLIRAILLWIVSSWRPAAEFSYLSLKSMFSFGSRMLVSGLIDTFFNNILQTFIGKIFSAVDLGYYTRAKTMETSATFATSASLGQVTYPALTPFQDNDVLLKKAYRKTIRLSLFFHFPLMIGLWAIADPLFRFLLTDKWAPSIPYFQILCFAGLLYPLHVLNLNILKVKGRSDLFLRLEIIKKAVIILVILVTYRWGIIALLFGQIGISIFAYFINSYYSGRLIDYKQCDQLLDLMPSFITAGLMGFCMFLAGSINLENNFLLLIIQTIVGIVSYTSFHFLLKSTELSEVIDIIRNIIKKLNYRSTSLP